MAMQPMRAYRPGTCAACGGVIAMDALFVWGGSKGDRVHFPGCASEHTAKTEAPVEREWSDYQEALFRFGTDGTGSAIVQACAGSGKTSTLEQLARRLDPSLSVKYLVFNKKNAVEAQQRMPANVDASTFHSSCNAALSQKLERPKVDDKKVSKLLKDMHSLGQVSDREMEDIGYQVRKLVGLAKNFGIDAIAPNTHQAWRDLIEHFDISFDVDSDEDPDYADHIEDRAIEIGRKLLAASNRRTDVIDFDDMLYLTVKLHVSLPRYDMVLVDESQDTAPIQRSILRMMMHPSSRLIAVGDEFQAIYGFRGASSDAMQLIKQEFGCITLPLSINYRCGRAIIREAQRFYPGIQAWEKSPEGSVEWLKGASVHDFGQTDAILCRVTAPLITLAYRLLGNGIGCTVLGRDIGEGLVALIHKMQGKRKSPLSIEQLQEKLEAYRVREVVRLTARGEEDKAQSVVDKVESLEAAIDALPEDRRTILDLIDHIQGLFSDNGEGRLTLATVHKAKGLEWRRVYILDPFRMPSKWARRDWMKVQENNISYIAVTRAKEQLFYVALDTISDAKNKEGAAA